MMSSMFSRPMESRTKSGVSPEARRGLFRGLTDDYHIVVYLFSMKQTMYLYVLEATEGRQSLRPCLILTSVVYC